MDTTTISQATAPVELSPMSEDEGERAIANLLDGNLGTPDPAQSKEAQPEPTASDDDDEGLVFESDDEGNEPEGQQAPAKPEIGDDFMVALADGQQISLGDLKRNNLFQRDYSRKTEELKAERARIEQETRQWRETEERTLAENRNLVIALSQQFMPEPPNPEMLDKNSPNYDPFGFMEAEASYKQRMSVLENVVAKQRADEWAKQEQAAQKAQAALKAEEADWKTRLPKFKDEAKVKAFVEEASGMLESVYKIDPAELGLIDRGAYLHILHDAIQYQKLKAKGAQTVKDLPSAPKLVGRQRSTPQTEQARDDRGRFEALRKTGSVEAGDRAIEALLLRKG